MIAKQITAHLERLGFTRSEHPTGSRHYLTAGSSGILVDCMKVRSFRLFLGVKCVPASFPSLASIEKGQIDAESPWFQYRGAEDRDLAVSNCLRWIDEVGLPFLANPFSKELHRWITEDKILIRDRGVIIPIPRISRLP
jgi:hypothetical protein